MLNAQTSDDYGLRHPEPRSKRIGLAEFERADDLHCELIVEEGGPCPDQVDSVLGQTEVR